MTMVNDINGKAIDFEAAMALADPEICEEIDNGLDGSETEQRFIGRYAELHAEKYDGEEFAPYFGLAW